MRLKGHAEFSRLRAFLFCLPLFASGGCFDYTETIFFGADLSGHVDLDYTVPLRAGSDDPLISHFLVQEGEIEKRLSILLGRKADIHDFTKDIKVDQHGARHARVQFKVTFRSPARTGAHTYWKKQSLLLRRTLDYPENVSCFEAAVWRSQPYCAAHPGACPPYVKRP
jgi:hypothetical protein